MSVSFGIMDWKPRWSFCFGIPEGNKNLVLDSLCPYRRMFYDFSMANNKNVFNEITCYWKETLVNS